jgi:hypothetical protein
MSIKARIAQAERKAKPTQLMPPTEWEYSFEQWQRSMDALASVLGCEDFKGEHDDFLLKIKTEREQIKKTYEQGTP